MYIVSYDVASKSLAVAIIYFNEKWKDELYHIRELFAEETNKTQTSEELCRSAIKYLDMVYVVISTIMDTLILDVVDIIPGKKIKDTTVTERSNRLSGYLNMMDSIIDPLYNSEKNTHIINTHIIKTPIQVLVEYQMGPNDKSRNVGSQILYHYSTPNIEFFSANFVSDLYTPINKYQVAIVGPSLKNKICLCVGGKLSEFIPLYAKNYDANKAHSKFNFLGWLKKQNMIHLIKNIKNKNIDDIADACNQAIAWIHLKSDLITS
jgi:hypothetical protein